MCREERQVEGVSSAFHKFRKDIGDRIMAVPEFVFFEGKIVPYSEVKVGVLTHALNYGTGVFGGLRGYWNSDERQMFVFRPLDHYRRFLDSGRILRMELPYTKESLTEATLELIRKQNFREDVYIRPLAFYGDEIIGVRLHNLTPKLSIAVIPFGKYIEKDDGAHVTISSWLRVEDNMIPARGKISGSYVNSAFSKTDAQLSGFDEAIVLNQSGHVSEGSAENIFMVKNGVFITPPVNENILEGIVRRTIIQLVLDDLEMQVHERPIDRTELFLADEIFFSGTGAQIAAITKIDHRSIADGKIGPLTSRLRDLFFRVVQGRESKYRNWCMPVYKK
jgi:branched-chain amino acid aminotransferase